MGTPSPSASAFPRLDWLDPLKGIALLWILLVHFVEQVFGSPFANNPVEGWPPFDERLSQLAPLSGNGAWDIPLNLLRYIGWAGDAGVTLFLLASGAGLAWGLLARRAPASLPARPFWSARFRRIYPAWWAAHGLLLFVGLATGWGLSPGDGALLPSLIGIRATPGTYYYGAPAWWYVGLLVQLYLVFPWLWRWMRSCGPARFLVTCGLASLVVRGGLLLLPGAWVDIASRGALCFVARLPEFAFGMALAARLFDDPGFVRRLRSLGSAAVGVVLWTAGVAAGLSLPGMTVAIFLQGTGAFLVLVAVLLRLRSPRVLAWLGTRSYGVYLVHHPLILLLVPEGAGVRGAVVGGILAVGGALALGPALEAGTEAFIALLVRWSGRSGRILAGLRVAAIGAGAFALLLGAEAAVRSLDPQEVLGWGERPSLEPDDAVGWRLKPSTRTHLRWESYDYRILANREGFPGPDVDDQRRPGDLRVMVTGDAFSSAEGVDTAESWPRLLEDALRGARPDRPVEVLNFAITGHGPDQYARVVERFAPRFRPDVVLAEVFVNDFADVLWTDDEFRRSIGFDQPDPSGPAAWLKRHHLKKWFRVRVAQPFAQSFLGVPLDRGRVLGHVALLEAGAIDAWTIGPDRVRESLRRMRDATAAIRATLVVVMVPASVQVCGASDLPYWPAGLEIAGPDMDADRPQRTMGSLASQLGLRFVDLRPVLAALPSCPYHPDNMHWLPSGHEAVAEAVARIVSR